MKRQCFIPNGLQIAFLGLAVTLPGTAVMGSQARAQALAAPVTQAQVDHKYRETLNAAAEKYFPGEERKVAAKRIFRLTRDQIDASVETLLPGYYTRSIKSKMPKDPLQTNYEYADLLSFNAANIGALSGWIKDIAARVRKKPAGVINCTASSNSDKCLKAQARRFAIRAFRADVSDEKLDRIAEFYVSGVKKAGFDQATSELVEVVLHSPDFLFRKEVEVDRNSRLLPVQYLQALTYIIADAPPERLGFDATKAGSYLLKSTQDEATINAIVSSKESREKLLRFFKAWLEIKEPGEFKISRQFFPEFDDKLAGAMLDETNRFLRAQLSTPAPKLSDITQSTRSFVSKPLESIYATRAADAQGRKAVDLDPARRLGIFSQPALLASHSGPTDSRPIKRGVFWVRKVMCMELQPPPKGVDLTVPPSRSRTTRQRIERVTNRRACIGCHKVIDPFAFFQESYDALGRWRDTEKGSAIDTSISVDFLDEGPANSVSSVEALKTFTNSMMFKQCFVRQLFRFYMGRGEEPSDDPLLEDMFLAFADNDDIFELIKILSASDRIARRR